MGLIMMVINYKDYKGRNLFRLIFLMSIPVATFQNRSILYLFLFQSNLIIIVQINNNNNSVRTTTS